MQTFRELVTVDVSELWALGERLGNERRVAGIYRDELSRSLATIGDLVVRNAQTNLQRSGAVDTQDTLQGFRTRITPGRDGSFTLEVSNASPGASATEYGRDPGSRMPPEGALLGWMARHGIPETMEFVLRRSIARNGITARPFLRPAVDQTRGPMHTEMQQAARRAAVRVIAA